MEKGSHWQTDQAFGKKQTVGGPLELSDRATLHLSFMP